MRLAWRRMACRYLSPGVSIYWFVALCNGGLINYCNQTMIILETGWLSELYDMWAMSRMMWFARQYSHWGHNRNKNSFSSRTKWEVIMGADSWRHRYRYKIIGRCSRAGFKRARNNITPMLFDIVGFEKMLHLCIDFDINAMYF